MGVTTSLEFELQVQRLLLQKSTSEACVDLVESFFSEPREFGDVEGFANLCLYSGNAGIFQKFCLQLLERNEGIPWAHFAESFALNNRLSSVIQENLLELAQENEGLGQLARTQVLEDSTLQAMRTALAEEKKLYAEQKKNDYLVQADICASQGLLEEQEKYLELAAAVQGQSPAIQKRLEALAQNKAERMTEDKEWHEPLLWEQVSSEEELQLLQCFESSVRSLQAENPIMAQDYALLFFWMGGYEQALRCIEQMPEDSSRWWLHVEILFRSRDFVSLLELLRSLEPLVAQNPDATLSIVYWKALAYWNLREKAIAIGTMESLVARDPDYRACHSILNRWKSELK